LYVTRFAPFDVRGQEIALTGATQGNVLLRNNGNGTFTDVTSATGLSGKSPNLGVSATDINNDRAVDLLVTAWHDSPLLYSNPREGAFDASKPWKTLNGTSTAGAITFDFDKD